MNRKKNRGGEQQRTAARSGGPGYQMLRLIMRGTTTCGGRIPTGCKASQTAEKRKTGKMQNASEDYW
jgi:hypothetical protein